MENKSVEKYGLVTAIFIVAGSVIGSGIFTVTYRIASATGYNVLVGFFALLVGALIMMVASTVYGTIVTESGKAGGLVEFAEVTYGKRASYTVGFYKATIFIPALVAILSFFTARFIVMFITGWVQADVDVSFWTWILAPILATGFIALNYFKPLIAGKFQVIGSLGPMILLLFIGIVGTIFGLVNGTLVENLTNIPQFASGAPVEPIHWFTGLVAGIAISKFAYEGWVIATTVGNDIKDKRKNLPRALLIGTFIVLILYSLFFIGIVASTPAADINANSPSDVVVRILGHEFWGQIVLLLIISSCASTLNGFSMSVIRAPQLVAATGNGIKPEKIVKTNDQGLSIYSAIYGLIASFILIIIVGLASFGRLTFGDGFVDVTVTQVMVIPIVVIYMQHTLDFIFVMRKYKNVGVFRRFILPTLALGGAFLIFFEAVTNPSIWFGVLISLVLLLIAQVGYKTKGQK